MNGCYDKILDKIDDRIAILKKHGGPTEKQYDNQYAELMDAVSRIIGVALMKELEDLRNFIQRVSEENCE